jgi:2,3-bisphosphoglycerate-independent phosphoglycerate mutase
MERRRILLIIFDGLGDRPVTELGHKTPLEAANKPNLDWFAQNGINGLLDPIAPGVRPGSDTSHLALLGYDPFEVYTGRGPFEAAGVGIDVAKGDIAFRGNFVTVDADGKIVDRRAGRIRDGTDELAKALDGMRLGRVRALFRAGTEHRAALVLRGKGLSPKVTDTDPHEEGLEIRASKALEPKAKATAKAVNAFTERVSELLKGHAVNKARASRGEVPANAVVLRGAGIVPHLEAFPERYGTTAAGIAGVALIKGICRAVGIDVLDVPGATGGMDTDMIAKADAALAALGTREFVLLNVKAADLCGHDGKASEKIRVIERLDQMMAHLRSRLPADVVLGLTADHSTPVSLKDHSGDPVPLTIFAEGVHVDDVARFDERSVARGGLARVRGLDLMPILLSLANRAEKFGA